MGGQEVRVELCTPRTVRVQLSLDGPDGYRPEDPQYYMVQKNEWDPVEKTVTEEDGVVKIRTSEMEIRVQKSPLRIGMYDLEGNLLSKDADDQGLYWSDDGTRGVKKVEGTQNAGGIFGFGSGDHGRRSNLNRYDQDFTEFSMSHGRVIAPFFMSTVGYGIFLNTIEKDTTFFKQGGGFETQGYLDYYFMYGPDFKTILNEYAEITGRMELYGKWAHGFMLSKYGNDNATQAEFLEWIHRLRDDGYPADCYVFDYGWRGDVADNDIPQHGAGQKWGKQMWSNDTTKFPDIDAMFQEADELGFHVGLHNNAGTPEASGGDKLYMPEYEEKWVQSYMDSVITTGYGDWFWPDEFDVLGSNTAPTFSSKGAYEAWQEYTVESRPMFITRGSYAGQHYATAWSGDIQNTSAELENQIGFSIDTGLIGYWASSHDLGGFMSRPRDELYTRWVSEFGAWNGIMRTHGHDGREPWTFDETAQETLKQNLKIRYALYPYVYSLAWQGYSQGVPIMRAMLLEDGSQYNPDAWDLNKQYYYGDWFLVAPASATTDTVVSVWLPPETTWYNYYTGERYEGGEIGKTIHVAAALDEIPVFVKAGAIVPMGPDVNYADEKPLDPLTLDIYPKGTTTFTLYEDDGESRRYITEDAYSTTTFESVQDGKDISFKIHAREDHNPDVYTPDERSYNLKFNHIAEINGVTINGTSIEAAESLEAYNAAEQAYWLDAENNIVYVRTPDTGEEINVVLDSNGIVEPELGDEDEGLPPPSVSDGDVYELEEAEMLPTATGEVKPDNEWKGYTGSGFAKGFKAEGDAIEFKVDVETAGTYDLVLRVNNGKKNDPQYDSSPRTGGLYIQGDKAADLSFEITDVWGNTIDGVKQGVWVDYTYRVELTAGENTIRIVSEGSNPGNYNLDSITFNYVDTSVNAFSQIEAESASYLEGDIVVAEDSSASDGNVLSATGNGAWAQFDEVRGSGRDGISIRVKSTTGGSIVVYENGVGDKILATITLPSDGEWHTIDIESRDTDAVTSNIFLSFVGEEDMNCDVDWFKFTTTRETIYAYDQIEAETATERHNIDTSSKTVNGEKINFLNHIENGDWVKFTDMNFGNGGVTGFETRVAAGLQGGTVEVRLDSVSGVKVAEVEIESTGDWNTLQVFSADCEDIKGIHDVYLKFVNTTTTNSICDMDWFHFIRDVATVSAQVEGGSATATVDAPDPVEEGDLVTVNISGIEVGKEFASISATTAEGDPVELTEVEAGKVYTFTMPASKHVEVVVTLQDGENNVESGSVFELENARGDTSSSNGDGSGSVRVDTEWAGYTGTGYTAGWKAVGHYVEFDVNVQESGIYDLVLHAGNGKKNGAQYDNSPRTGALYVDDVKVADFALEVHDSWGDWFEYAIEDVELTEGAHTIKIRSEGSDNSGNFNLDSVRFDRVGDLEEEPSEHMLTVTFPNTVELSIDGESQTIANLIGAYKDVVMADTELNLTFTPRVDGREIAGVTVNDEAIAEDSFDAAEYVYSAAMPNADTTIELGFTLVDKQNLRTTIEIAEGRADEAAEAVPSVKEKYEAALQAAKDVEAKKTATQDEINTAWSDLIDALHYLSFVAGDKSQLDIPMEIAESINRDLFTPDSLKALDEAYAAAEDLLDDEEVLEADITAAVDALYDAIYGLVYRADVTELEALVTKGDGIVANADQYIQNDAWTSFETVLAEAKTVLEDANATQDAVDTAAEDLAAAISALRLIPDKDALEALIGEAEAINTNKYTAKSVATMKAALSTAKAVLNDAEATEEEVADAVEALENSIDGLVEKNTSTGSKNSGSTSANVGNAYGAAGVVSASQSVAANAYVVSDTTVNFTLKRGSAYCFKMTVVNGNAMTPGFTVGNGDVLKTQFVAKIGNDYYYRVYATGTPGQSTGVYTTLPGQNATKHCTVTIG